MTDLIVALLCGPILLLYLIGAGIVWTLKRPFIEQCWCTCEAITAGHNVGCTWASHRNKKVFGHIWVSMMWPFMVPIWMGHGAGINIQNYNIKRNTARAYSLSESIASKERELGM